VKSAFKPKRSSPTVDPQSEIDTLASGLLEQWLAVGWKLRRMKPDYHLDYLLERVEHGELTGKIVYLQQKGHRSVAFTNGFTGEAMEKKHLRYYAEKVDLPVFLVCVDTIKRKGYYVFLQEWIDHYLSAEKLRGEGTRTVKVPLAKCLDEVPTLINDVQHSLRYMREKRPGSILAAMSAEERRVAALDPRFDVRLDIIGGQKFYHLRAKEDISVSLKVTGDNIKLFQELYDYGKPLSAGPDGITVQGLPIIEQHAAEAGMPQIAFGPQSALEVQWNVWSDDAASRFRLTLEGPMTRGAAGYLFRGQQKGGPIRVEIRFPLVGAPNAGTACLSLSWDFACWVGQPIADLCYFDGVLMFGRLLKKSATIRHSLNYQGRDFFPGDFNGPETEPASLIEGLEVIADARIAAEIFRVHPTMQALNSITVDQARVIANLRELATAGGHCRTGMNFSLNATLSNISDPSSILRRVDQPPGPYRVVIPGKVGAIFDARVELGTLEYTLDPARLVITDEARRRLEAGDNSDVAAEIQGVGEATFSVRRVPSEDPGG